jgi:endogenous inhibitor of DNA gyrase (YacG/DUF329 family)
MKFMSAPLCPNCGTPIGDTGMSHEVNRGPLRQGATCPTCAAKLVRNPESTVPELRDWRPAEDDEPPEGDA